MLSGAVQATAAALRPVVWTGGMMPPAKVAQHAAQTGRQVDVQRVKHVEQPTAQWEQPTAQHVPCGDGAAEPLRWRAIAPSV